MENQPEIELKISSSRFGLSEIPNLKIGIKITNRWKEVLQVNLSGLALYVNSVRSVAWDLAMQNGTLGNLRLAPGQPEIVQWELGEALFESAGKYQLDLYNKGQLVGKQEIEITNKPEQ